VVGFYDWKDVYDLRRSLDDMTIGSIGLPSFAVEYVEGSFVSLEVFWCNNITKEQANNYNVQL